MIKEKFLKVADEFRKNSLSIIPGGSIVYAEYHVSPRYRSYDKIKDVPAWIREALLDPKVKRILIEK